ncbi:O-succinylbenzoic acid--CoA ligase [Limnochorda pilosa]|uniref:2-succinylbenzoate--CoA ligase n=1 Tax=Limnochorda pilosa TaxID=1555112 RepID=A0A0K2SMN4_LIMPI|nr:O-succinylbenzoic acid--CoA ligase [Limnochorda pilosa]
MDWLRWRAEHTPEREVLRFEGRSWSFGELDREVSLLARRLAVLSVGEGDRLAVLLSPGPLFVQAVHAVGRLGAVLVPLNTRLAAPELVWQLKDVEARLLLYDEVSAPQAEAIAARLPGLAAIRGGRLDAVAPADVPLRFQLDPAAVHTIVYTSGTTGRPKGAQLTYGNHGWSALVSALNLGLSPDDRWLAPMPLFHVGGLAILFRSVIYGIPTLLQPRFDPDAVHRAIDVEGATLLSVVSAMLARMLEVRGGRPYPPSLRAVLVGGGPAPQPLLDAAARLGMPVVPTYGLTETSSQVTTLAPGEAPRRPGSSGRPLFGVELRIEQDDRPQPPGEPGEIAVRGPTVMAGYFRRPEESARALAGGWLHTGDLGYLDPEGYLYVLDRREDLIVSGGENVYPAEVEAALLAHPAVLEAGVTGVPDPRWGQAVLAAVRLRPGARVTEEEIRGFCRERLAGYKVPAHVRFVDALPRNAAGKLLRRRLAD